MEKLYKIGCVIPVSGRPGLVNKTITRLSRQQDCDVTIIVIGSEEQDRENIGKVPEGYHFFLYRNSPLGAKWQFGIDFLRNLKPDINAYLHTGSDEWLTDNYCTVGMDALNADDANGMVGVRGYYVYDIETKRMIYWPGYANERKNEPIGAGRLISRQTLEALNWGLVDTTLDSGLDATIMKNVLKTGKNVKISDESSIAVIGIKTSQWTSKNVFDSFLKEGHPIPPLMTRNFIQSNFPDIGELDIQGEKK